VVFLFAVSIVSKEEVIADIRNCAQRLGRTPTLREAIKIAKIKRYSVHHHLGGLPCSISPPGAAYPRVRFSTAESHTVLAD
jgi:hypothetical protein